MSTLRLIITVFHVDEFVDKSGSVIPNGAVTVAVLENEDNVALLGEIKSMVNSIEPFTGKNGKVALVTAVGPLLLILIVYDIGVLILILVGPVFCIIKSAVCAFDSSCIDRKHKSIQHFDKENSLYALFIILLVISFPSITNVS